jgi:hypothetical protein
MRRKTIKLLVLSISALLLISCSKSNVSSVEYNQLRNSNCSLIDSWIQYVDDPSYEESWGDKNTYEYMAEQEKNLWRKLQPGDESYELLLALRRVAYAQQWWDIPSMGDLVTPENVFRFPIDFFSDDEEWSIIRDATTVCTNFTDKQLANYFAYALLV